jgi:mannan-binding protein
MKSFPLLTLALYFALLFSLFSCDNEDSISTKEESISTKKVTLTNAQQLKNCSFSRSGDWWTQAYSSLPANIANNPVTGEPEFCEFYQFAEDWFLYLISPSDTSNSGSVTQGATNWENQQRFPLLETKGTNSCDDAYPKHALNIRTAKFEDDSEGFVLPERIDQAGGVYAIYDQQGNVVFYEIRFSKNLCDYPAIQAKPNFPGKTLEIKLAWRVLNSTDNASDYYQTTAEISGKSYTLGLIGLHIVVTADNHPEMVWITLEHNNIAVVCDKAGATQPAYDFTSATCAQNINNCKNLNQTLNSKAVKLPAGTQANDICNAFPYGTVEGQPIEKKGGLNIALIQKLNAELQGTIFTQPGLPSSLSVWKNYAFKGALWVSDTRVSSSATNQRGSLQLANTVMETFFQGTTAKPGSAVNCFACHNYNGTASDTPINTGVKNTGKNSISHIFDEIISGQSCNDVPASQLINNQSQAEANCPATCTGKASNLAWNGQWTNQNAETGQQLPMTVCGCCIK